MSEDNRCWACLLPGATLSCAGCHGAPNPNSTKHIHWYCDKSCQAADWIVHKKVCKGIQAAKKAEKKAEADKRLYRFRAERVAKLVQMLFYAYMEEAWSIDVKDITVVREGDEVKSIVLMGGRGRGKGVVPPSFADARAGGLLFEFPRMIPENARQIVFSDHHSFLALAVMVPAVVLFFQDLVNDADEDIVEMTYTPKPELKRLVQKFDYYGNPLEKPLTIYGNSPWRGVFEITLKTGEKLVLDLTGAEYGLPHVPLWSYEEYHNRFVEEVKVRDPVRKALKGLVKVQENLAKKGKQNVLCIHGAMAGKLIGGLILGASEKNFQVQKCIELDSEQAFEDRTEELMKAVKGELKYVTRLAASGLDQLGPLIFSLANWAKAPRCGE